MDNKIFYTGEIRKIIGQDPTELVIRRIVKENDGYGGFTETEITHTVTGRLYSKRSVRELLDVSGQYTSYTAIAAEKILCMPDQDIQEGDTFATGGRVYKVVLAKNYFDICIQCELQVIKT